MKAVTLGRKDDHDKERWDLVPWGPIRDFVRVLTFGAKKYAPNNWQKVPDATERYFAAAMRHLTAYRQDEIFDKESKLPHLAHAICCLVFMAWFDRGMRLKR